MQFPLRGSRGDYVDTGSSMWGIGGAPGEYKAAAMNVWQPYRSVHAQPHIKP